MTANHVEGVSCLHMHNGMCSKCAAKLENELRDAKESLREVKNQLGELDRLEKLSHQIRDQSHPRIGLGDGERASLSHGRIIAELQEKLEWEAPEPIKFPHRTEPPEATDTTGLVALGPTRERIRQQPYGLSTEGLYGVEFCNKASAQATHALVQGLRSNLKVFEERAKEAEAQRDHVWAYPAAKTLKEEVDRLTERVKVLAEFPNIVAKGEGLRDEYKLYYTIAVGAFRDIVQKLTKGPDSFAGWSSVAFDAKRIAEETLKSLGKT